MQIKLILKPRKLKRINGLKRKKNCVKILSRKQRKIYKAKLKWNQFSELVKF